MLLFYFDFCVKISTFYFLPVDETLSVVLPVPLLFSPDPPSPDLNRLSCPALFAAIAAAAASLACCCALSSLSISSLSSRSY